MLSLPVRFELRVGSVGPICSFTAWVDFSFPPPVSHKIIFILNDRQYGVTVTDVYHYIGNEPDFIIISSQLQISEYDEMLRVFDWFKASFTVADIRSDTNQPHSYYSFYRSLVHVLGLTRDPFPTVKFDPESITIFAEASRAVLMAEQVQDINQLILTLHQIMGSERKLHHDSVDMLSVIKKWESAFNKDGLFKWEASIETCIELARQIFGKLKSVQMPTNLRDDK